MALSLTVIIPTKNRARMIQALLESMRNLAGLDQIRPQIIVADNNSEDGTWEVLQEITSDFPVPITVIKVYKPGKSADINEAVRLANGQILAFLDDDVTTDRGWLEAVERFVSQGGYQVGQGRIQLQLQDADDPEMQRLIQRFRTIPSLDFHHSVERVHSLNGANFVVSREALERVGLFDERLGPGASGTSEDVELARRFARAGIAIGYMPEAIAYHGVDRTRLTEEYFKSIHKKQGKSRLVIKDRSVFHILFDLCRMSLQYGIDSLVAKERRRYRSKGRIYHYLGMLEAKLNPDPAVAGENKERDASLPSEQTDSAADILD
jgi:GT2 family glycosyltransferase